MATVETVSGTSKLAEEQETEVKYLTFTLGIESYGMEVRHVREIIRIQDITSVPSSEPHVKGVINLRGKVVPVVDLRLKFDLGEEVICERTCIIVVEVNEQETTNLVGIVVDKVEEVLSILPSEIDHSPDLNAKMDNEFIKGIIRKYDSVKTLIDINTAFN